MVAKTKKVRKGPPFCTVGTLFMEIFSKMDTYSSPTYVSVSKTLTFSSIYYLKKIVKPLENKNLLGI